MPLWATVALLVLGLGLCGVCRWYEARPRQLGEVRLFPSTLLLALGVVLVVVALAHLVSLLTGVPLRGRRMV
jgi:hypothetical protein